MDVRDAKSGGGGSSGGKSGEKVVIYVQLVAGKKADAYEVDPATATIGALKRAIEARDEYPFEAQRLIDSGDEISDNQHLLAHCAFFHRQDRKIFLNILALVPKFEAFAPAAGASDRKDRKDAKSGIALNSKSATATAALSNSAAANSASGGSSGGGGGASASTATPSVSPVIPKLTAQSAGTAASNTAASATAADTKSSAAANGKSNLDGLLQRPTPAEELIAKKRLETLKTNAIITACVRRIAGAADRNDLIRIVTEEIDKLAELREEETVVPSQWSCQNCTYTNPRIAVVCEMCGEISPADKTGGQPTVGRPPPGADADGYAYQLLPSDDAGL